MTARRCASCSACCRPGGIALLTRAAQRFAAETYENAAITDPADRYAHFSAEDHVRYYGLDFADRLAEVGFTVDDVPPDAGSRRCAYGLLRDEWLYVAQAIAQAPDGWKRAASSS